MAEAAGVIESTAPPEEIPAAPAAPETPTAAPASSEPKPSASAPEPQGKDTPATEPAPASKGNRSFDRKIGKLTKEVAEQRARADSLERLYREAQTPATPQGAPDIKQFTDANGYVDAEGYAKAREEFGKRHLITESQRQQQQQQSQAFQKKVVEGWEAKLTRADDKYEDWDEVVPELKPDNYAAVAIMQADNGEDVAYHLFKNTAEAQRIAALSPFEQIHEIAKLSAKLLATPPVVKVSNAPAPITPVSGASSVPVKKLIDMDQDEFEKARRARIAQRR